MTRYQHRPGEPHLHPVGAAALFILTFAAEVAASALFVAATIAVCLAVQERGPVTLATSSGRLVEDYDRSLYAGPLVKHAGTEARAPGYFVRVRADLYAEVSEAEWLALSAAMDGRAK